MSTAPRTPVRVLFVCIGNACRSPLAESMARKLLPPGTIIESAGTHPLGRIPEETAAVLSERGFSADGLASRGLNRDQLAAFDYVIDLGGMLAHPPGFNGVFEHWPTLDPYRRPIGVWRNVRDELERRVLELGVRIRANSPPPIRS